jgi:hypothetical protein
LTTNLLSTNVFAMGYSDNQHDQLVLMDAVDNAIGSDANPPNVIFAFKLHATWGSRLVA